MFAAKVLRFPRRQIKVSVASELKKLSDLHSAGILTDREFERAKEKVFESTDTHRSELGSQSSVQDSPLVAKFGAQPLKIILTVFLCLAASTAVVFAALVPFNLADGKVNCSAPIGEAFVSEFRNPNYDPNYKKSGNRFLDQMNETIYGTESTPNFCAGAAQERLWISGPTLAVSVGLIFWMWRSPNMTSSMKAHLSRLKPVGW
jgi:hypothetical protein